MSESSEMRRKVKKLKHLKARNRCLNSIICCRCCKYPEYGSASNSPRRFDFDGSEEKRQRLISEDGDCRLSMSHQDRDGLLNASLGQHDGSILHNAEEHHSLQKTIVREESSSLSDSSDSMGQSDIWDPHITTDNVTSPNAMSRSMPRQSQVSPQHRFLQR